MPFNLTPDFIPIPGHLDDVTITPVRVWIVLRFVLAQLVPAVLAFGGSPLCTEHP